MKEEAMFGSSHIPRRIATGIAVAAALTAVAVPSALAGGFDGRSPDTRDAALAAQAPSGSLSPAQRIIRQEDARRTAAQRQHESPYGARDGWYGYAVSLTNASRSTPVLDGRSPDTRDFAAQAHSPVVTVVESPGFQWGDFGIGIAAALGAVLIGFASIKLLSGRQGREQTDPVATA
jgi:hypothetical protein